MVEYLIAVLGQFLAFITYKIVGFELAIICYLGVIIMYLADIKNYLKDKEEEYGHKRNSR